LQEEKPIWGCVRKKLSPRNSMLIIEEMCVLLLTERVCHVGEEIHMRMKGRREKEISENGLCDGFVTI
jgi:hypothetical protein